MNISFIHEYPELEAFELVFEENERFLESFDLQMRAYQDELEMLRYMGESTEDLEYIMESEKKGFFETIGEKILEIIRKFEQTVKNILAKVASLFSRKSGHTDQEIDAAWKKNPELAKSFMESLRNGSIKYSDYENIDKMVDEACAIIDQLEKDKINSRTAVDKFNACVEKFNKALVPSATLLATLGAGAAGIVSIVSFRNKLREETFKRGKYNTKMEALRKIAAEDVYKSHGVEYKGEIKDKNGKVIKKVNDYGYNTKKDMAEGMKEENKRVAASWALQISATAAKEYNRPLSYLCDILGKTVDIMTSGKLFANKKMDVRTYAQKQRKETGTAKTIIDKLETLNGLDKNTNSKK